MIFNHVIKPVKDLGLGKDTLHLAVNLLDRMLANMQTSPDDFGLGALGCLLIAAKKVRKVDLFP